jgi:hypothetical protein
MTALRAILLRHRATALLLVLLALAMKIAVPAGFMVATDAKVFTIAICADASGVPHSERIVVPVFTKHDGGSTDHARDGGACPFSALSMASLGGAAPALLAAALAFVFALGFAPLPRIRGAALTRLRPPLRAPPLQA